MSVQLLDKTRKINRLLHNNHSTKVVFNDICETLAEVLDSQVLVISKKGKVLGASVVVGMESLKDLAACEKGTHIEQTLNDRFLGILSTKENLDLAMLGFEEEKLDEFQGIITPIDIAGERLGTLVMCRKSGRYKIDDVIISEYATAVIGLEMIRALSDESSSEVREERIVKSAINSLSYSEQSAILSIFEELEGLEGVLVASKIADRVGITRSVIVNALRKFESAGIIEAKSSGMKGTYIKILTPRIFEHMDYVRLCMVERKKK